MSLPARGAWIETMFVGQLSAQRGRSPHGGRGLKHGAGNRQDESLQSLPARGAWIETMTQAKANFATIVAPRTGGVD